MDKELQTILSNLEDTGCGKDAIERAAHIYKAKDKSELVRYLKCCRCGLMDELHESQRKVDRLDFLIRRLEKSKTETENR